MKKRVLYISCLLLVILTSCASSNYIEKNYEKNIAKLQSSAAYNSEPVSFEIKYLVDQEQAAKIRQYYKENAGLDLYAIAASPASTWEKAVELAVFVAKNVPHDNQKEWLEDRSAIPLWEYACRLKNGFNCRCHAILLSELLLAAGIKTASLPAYRNGRMTTTAMS